MKKSQSFVGGATVLVASTLLVKLIGALYKIPLTNLLGGVGMGYYMSAYGLFNPIFAMSVAGFPIAISKLVSKGRAENHNFNSYDILVSGAKIFFYTGFFLTILMIILSKPFSGFVDNDRAYYAVMAIAPAITFAATGAAFRGYYEGHQNMYPTGISQAVEAITKLICGITFVVIGIDVSKNVAPQALMRLGNIIGITPEKTFADNLPIIAALGIFGVTIGSIASFVFLFIYTLFSSKIKGEKTQFKGNITESIIKIAVPVCLGSLMINITSIIDLMTIMNGLSKISSSGLDLLYKSYANVIPLDIATSEIPSFLYGTYTGLAMTIFNIVPSLTIAIGTVALPIVSNLNSSRKTHELKTSVCSIIKVTGIFTLPAGIGISALSQPILNFFFSSNPIEVSIAVSLLKILGVSVIFVGFISPITSILQGIGAVYVPAKLMIVGGVTKLVINHFLISMPLVNIKAAPVSTLICYCIIVIGGLYAIENRLELNINLIGLFFKPAFGAILCGITAYFGHGLLYDFFETKLVLIPAIVLGGIMYIICILKFKIITKNDLSLLKNGEKFSKLLASKGYLG